jgi:hypothetical protein
MMKTVLEMTGDYGCTQFFYSFHCTQYEYTEHHRLNTKNG